MMHVLLMLICRPRATLIGSWLMRLSTRLLARQLQVPEPVVRAAGFYLYARLDAWERRLLTLLASAAGRT